MGRIVSRRSEAPSTEVVVLSRVGGRDVQCSASVKGIVSTLQSTLLRGACSGVAPGPDLQRTRFHAVDHALPRGGRGAPITIVGAGFGVRQGPSVVTIGGVPVARTLVWGQRNAANPALDKIVVQPGPLVRGGEIAVRVGKGRSAGGPSFRPTNGAVHEVSTTGSDVNSCTEAQPCASILRLVSVMQPGDVGLVRGGTYDESEVWIRGDRGQSGTADAPKVIAAYPGENVVLSNASRPVVVDADYITIAGFDFRNGKSTGVPDTGLPGRRGNRFVNNAFSGMIGYSAIDLHGDDHEIVGNVCDVSGSTVGTQGHCFYISYGSGARLRYNAARGAPGYGIHVFDQQRSASDFRRVIRDVTIEGNVLRASTERSGLILAMGDEGGRGNAIDCVVVRGNTFTENNHAGFVIGSRVRSVTVTGNRFDGNGRQGLHITDDETIDGVTATGNTFVRTRNDRCRTNCSWYPVVAISSSGRARNVSVEDNRLDVIESAR